MSCGKLMGSATLRSADERSLDKMAWWMGKLRCPPCADERREEKRNRPKYGPVPELADLPAPVRDLA